MADEGFSEAEIPDESLESASFPTLQPRKVSFERKPSPLTQQPESDTRSISANVGLFGRKTFTQIHTTTESGDAMTDRSKHFSSGFLSNPLLLQSPKEPDVEKSTKRDIFAEAVSTATSKSKSSELIEDKKEPITQLFGKPAGEVSTVFGGAVFGQTSSMKLEAAHTFGASIPGTSSTFGKPNTFLMETGSRSSSPQSSSQAKGGVDNANSKTSKLFGKTNVFAIESGGDKPFSDQTLLFGKKEPSTEAIQKPDFFTPVSSADAADKEKPLKLEQVLFGKKESATEMISKPLFGKPAGAFTSNVAFGKPLQETSSVTKTYSDSAPVTSDVLFGSKPRDKVFPITATTVTTSERKLLFGKVARTQEEGQRSEDDGRAVQEYKASTTSESIAEESSPKKGKSRRSSIHRKSTSLVSKEELSGVKSILCLDMPDTLLHRNLLKEHFSQFGNIVKLRVSPSKRMAIVTFEENSSALIAKTEGTELQGINISIFYSQTKVKSKSRRVREVMALQEPNPQVDDERLSLQMEESPQQCRSRESSPIPKITMSPAPVDEEKIMDLEEIVSQQALNDEDRYKILDARDKLMRLDIGTECGEVLVGACPDMCPEKERYMRIEKRQLFVYELLDGDVYDGDHKLCVKEYARSSADQEKPLPHELRPIPALRLTMTYLLTHIMDRCDDPEENLADWYNFLWDRTRAIRKDITQQQFCNKDSAELIEKCIRFHIHCSARLCEEEVFIFDPKLNDENLFKALKTLDEIYFDMAQCGSYSDNEAEFRAYEILLRLKYGDAHRVIATIREEVLNSTELRFAMEIYQLFVRKNFVVFFKKIKTEATYLQACALHRYFEEARAIFLRRINQAFITRAKSSQFPLESICRQFGFDSEEEAIGYLERQGLSTNKDAVMLERGGLKSKMAPKRSKGLVEKKRIGLLSEVINNSPIIQDPLKDYQPYSSFNSAGYLKLEAYGKEVEEAMRLEKEKAEELERQIETAERALNEVASETMDVIMDDCVQEETKTLCEEARSDVLRHTLSDGVLQELVEEMVSDVGEDSFKDALVRQQQETLRQKQLYQKAGQQVVSELMKQEIAKLCREVVMQEYNKEKKKVKQRDLRKCAEMLVKDTCKEFMEEELRKIVQEILEDTRQKRDVALKSLQKKMEHRLVKKYFMMWRSQTRWCSLKRNALKNLPPLPAQKSLKEQNESLAISASHKAQSMQSLQKLQSHNQTLMDIHCRHKELLNSMADTPIPLAQLVAKQLKDIKTHVIWKMLLCLSENHSLLERLKFKFCKDEDISVDTVDINENASVSVCSRICHNKPPLSDEIRSSSGCLYVVEHHDQFDWEDEKLRLNEFMDNISKYDVAVKVWVLTTSDQKISAAEVNERLGTSSCCVSDAYSEFDIHQQASDCVSWLAGKKVKNPGLSSSRLWTMIDDFIRKTVCHLMKEDLKSRMKKDLPQQEPNVLICLYNSAVAHLIHVVSDPTLNQIDWPPLELDIGLPPPHWNQPEFLRFIAHELGCIKLPELSIHPADTWAQVCDAVWDYVASVIYSDYSSVALFSSVNCALDEAKLQCENQQLLDSDDVCLDPDLVLEALPWTSIIQACINYKMDCVDVKDPVNDGQLIVYYRDEQLEAFQLPQEWLNATSVTHRLREVDEKLSRSKRQLEQSSEEEEDEGVRKMSRTHEVMKEQLSMLNNTLYQEKMADEALLRRLQQLDYDEDEDDDALPLKVSGAGALSSILSEHDRRQDLPITSHLSFDDQLEQLKASCQLDRTLDLIFERRLSKLQDEDDKHLLQDSF